MSFRTRMVAIALVITGLGLGAGCATVQPWERGRLANTCMQFDPNADRAAYAAHWQEAREGASGGFGIQGGGCGCK